MDSLIVPGTLESLSAIRKYVAAAAKEAGLDNRASYRLRLAVDEIATNAVLYGYQRVQRQGTLSLRTEIENDTLTIVMDDTGAAFDPRQRPRPAQLDLPLEERPIGGLGVYMAIREVDEFQYRRLGEINRNIFVMHHFDETRLAHDLVHVILPIGVALSGEPNFDRLLEMILTQAKDVCRADGGTLYLRAGEQLKFAIIFNDSLKIAAGGTTGHPISLPAVELRDKNGAPNVDTVAAHAAILGQSVNIPNIYTASGFDFTGTRAFDERNGYCSISTLTVPLKNHEKHVIGVLQLLNAQDPQSNAIIPFSSYHQQLVEALGSQAAVVLNNRILLENQKELLRYEHELQIGQQIQRSFLPERLPELPGWDLAADFLPAREVSGDFYDTILSPESGKLGLVIADVCDKGVGAALYMSLIRSLMRAFFMQFQSQPDIGAEATVAKTNRYLLENHSTTTMFATLFFAVLDPATGEVAYVNAGHNQPLLLGTGGIKARLKATGPAVGMFADARYSVRTLTLAPGEVLFAFTDGITEARNPAGEFYREERLLALLTAARGTPGELLRELAASVRTFAAGAPQSDDMTMLAVRRRPDGAS